MTLSLYKSILVPLTVLFIVSCASYEPVDMSAINKNVTEKDRTRKLKNLDPKKVFTIGDTVKISTKKGEFFKLKVASVSADTIHGKKRSVKIQDIALLETKNYRTVRMTAAGGVGTVYYTLVLKAAIKKVVVVMLTL